MSDEMLDILERLALPDNGRMPPEVAEYVLGIMFTNEEQERYRSLAERHNNGELSAEELKILEGFVGANALLSIVKAAARKSLAKHQPAA